MHVLPKTYIREWLSRLVLKRTYGRRKGNAVTLFALWHHTGIPLETLKYFAKNDPSARMSIHRQMLLSKVISQIENGELDFVKSTQDARCMVAVKPEITKPKVRYAAQVINGQVRLAYVDRPKPFREMPKFRDLWFG